MVFVLNPDGLVAILWRRVAVLCAILSTLIVSYIAVFSPVNAAGISLIYILDAVHLLDMVVRARLVALKRKGLIVEKKSEIFRQYLRSDALLDVVALLPIELIPMTVDLARSVDGDSVLQLMAYYRLNRLVKVLKVIMAINYEERLLTTSSGIIRLFKSLTLVGITVHFQACMWYAIACDSLSHDCRNGHWATTLPTGLNFTTASQEDRYVISLYWAVATSTCTGYGDIIGVTLSEKWLSIVSMLMGIILFGFILGGLASSLTNADSLRARYSHLFNTVKEHLFENAIKEDLCNIVKNYYEHMWTSKKGVQTKDVFTELPLAFQAELALNLNRNVIEEAHIFTSTSAGLRRMLAMKVKATLFLPSQFVVNRGDIGQHMCYLHRGTLEVLDDDDTTPVAYLRSGKLFGELNLLYRLPWMGSIRASTHCEVFMLCRSDLLAVLKHYPEEARLLQEAADNRYQRFLNDYCPDESSKIAESLERQRVSIAPRSHVLPMEVPDNFSHSNTGKLERITSLWRWWKNLEVSPKSRFASVWEKFVLTVVLFVCIIQPLEAAYAGFNSEIRYDNSAAGIFIILLLYVFDVVYLIDIAVAVKISRENEERDANDTNVSTTKRRVYTRSARFVLDVLAVLPLELVSLAWSDAGDQWRMLTYFRLNRMIKWYKFPEYFRRLEDWLGGDIGSVRTLKFLLYITIISHTVSCLWFTVACSSSACIVNSWAKQVGIGNSSSVGQQYITSLYWAAATMTSTGYGDISAYLTNERILAMSAMFIGLVLYGYCLSSIAATLANAASATVSFQERINAVREFMNRHHLSPGLIDRAQLYFDLLWRQNRGQAVPGHTRLMFDLPLSLQQDVALQKSEFSFSQVPLFVDCDTAFLRELSLVAHAYIFSPGDYIVYGGDIGRDMYLVKRGIVEVMSDDLKHVVCTIEPGGYFGEIGLMFGDVRSATVRAATYCELLMISRADLDRILAAFPIIGRQFTALTENRTHLREIRQAADFAMRSAMSRVPAQPSKPCVMSALALALNSPLAAVTRTELATTVAASIPDSYQRENVACAYSTELALSGTFVWRSRISEVRRRPVINQVATRSFEMDDVLQPETSIASCDLLARERPPRRPSLSLEKAFHRPSLSLKMPRRYSKVSPAPAHSVAEHRHVQVGGLYASEDDESLLQPPGRLAEILSRLLMPLTILPSSQACAVWEVVAVILAIISAITVSLQAGFLYNNVALCVLNYLIDTVFLVDMYFKFHTAFYNEYSVLVLEPLSCARRYMRTNFVLDLLCSFPLELFVPSITTGEYALTVLAMFRLNRLLRVYKLYQGFEYLESDIGRSTGLIRQIKFLIGIIIGTHWTACAWFLLVTVNGDLGERGRIMDRVLTWINQDGLALGNASVGEQYLVSLYFAAATTASVGYGDIHPYTDLERVFAVCVMISGIVCYGYIIASVAATLANADSQRGRYQEKLNAISTFMQDQDLCPSLQRRVMNFYEYLWEKNKGVEFKTLFQGMPNTLQADITLSLYKKILDKVPLFQNTELGFTKLLSMSIKPVYFLPGEYIVRKGDLGSEMFFIHRGTVDVVSEDGEVVFAQMDEGSFFGEISLVYSVPRTASIRAATNCDLFVLTKQDLDSVLGNYPHIERQINSVAEQRRQNVRKRSEATASAQAAGVSGAAAALRAAAATKQEENKGPGTENTQPALNVIEEEEDGEDLPEVLGLLERIRTWWQERVGRRLGQIRERVTSWNRFTIHPNNMLWRLFQYATILLSFVTFATITYQAAFQDHSSALWAVSTVFEPLFLLKLYLEFHIAYDDYGALIRDFNLVYRRYLKGEFVWDVIPVLPTLLTFMLLGDNFDKMLEVYSYIQLVRILRLYKVIAFFNAQSRKLNTRVLLVRISKFFAIILIFTHSVACIWYMIACSGGCRAGSWVDHQVTMGNRNLLNNAAARYCNSMYWAVATMTSTGYGDVRASNNYERVFASIVMILGKLLFGFVLGNITSTLANADIQRVHYDEKMEAVKKHMTDQQLPGNLKRQVLSYYQYLWERNKGVDNSSLFGDMPSCMKAEIYLGMSQEFLEKIPLFEGVNAGFRRNLVVHFRPVLFLPNDHLLRQGDTAQQMFCIKNGKVDVLNEDDRVIQTLSKGDFFSEESLIHAFPSKHSFRAATAVDVLALLKSDLDAVLVNYPQIRQRVDEWEATSQKSN